MMHLTKHIWNVRVKLNTSYTEILGVAYWVQTGDSNNTISHIFGNILSLHMFLNISLFTNILWPSTLAAIYLIKYKIAFSKLSERLIDAESDASFISGKSSNNKQIQQVWKIEVTACPQRHWFETFILSCRKLSGSVKNVFLQQQKFESAHTYH